MVNTCTNRLAATLRKCMYTVSSLPEFQKPRGFSGLLIICLLLYPFFDH